jgi:hypothetical protein
VQANKGNTKTEEEEISLFTSTLKSQLNCNYCKKAGHSEENCWHKNAKRNNHKGITQDPFGRAIVAADLTWITSIGSCHTTQAIVPQIGRPKSTTKPQTCHKIWTQTKELSYS